MNELTFSDFNDYFGALYHDHEGTPFAPMKWQTRLAAAACEGQWPTHISVPTGAGKTSAIEIAVFALAVQATLSPDKRTAPMRTFLVVDRRTVVSEAFLRAKRLRDRLYTATDGILKTVAERLCYYSPDSIHCAPLRVVELRGGIFRDPAWFQSLTQPMIVTSTVDQVGSRLLFRGYGVSRSARPIQATAVAHDSLVILDEAHISKPFSQTLTAVRNYQAKQWSEIPLSLPMNVVQMTATPPDAPGAVRLEISEKELADKTTRMGHLVNTSKLTTLDVATKAKGTQATSQLAKVLVEKATNEVFSEDSKALAIGIMCNMVDTAKRTVEGLLKDKRISRQQVHLVIGAMRPIDRDHQAKVIGDKIATGVERHPTDEPIFVVATQCIEVGADYDFDVLITEAAPVDALTQRFGRLNRGGRSITATAHVVMREDRIKADKLLESDEKAFKYQDPIYGNAMSFAWNWLQSIAVDQKIDFGISAFKQHVSRLDSDQRNRMSTSSEDAPVLLPAHLDLLCQTSTDPWPSPDVSYWLHGPQRNEPDVQVCWRADLDSVVTSAGGAAMLSVPRLGSPKAQNDRVHAISVCPPSSPECLSVSMRRLFAWLGSLISTKKLENDQSADIPSIADEAKVSRDAIPVPLRPVAWRGPSDSVVVQRLSEIKPGDTLVFPVTAGGWNELGYIPSTGEDGDHAELGRSVRQQLLDAALSDESQVKMDRDDFDLLAKIDIGSSAFAQSRDQACVRLHPNLLNDAALTSLYSDQMKKGSEFHITRGELHELICQLPIGVAASFENVRPSQLRCEVYGSVPRLAVTALAASTASTSFPPGLTDDGDDSLSQIHAGKPIELKAHLNRVARMAQWNATIFPASAFEKTIVRSAEVHDWGKADPRFQAMLIGGDLLAAHWEDRLYAKSASLISGARARKRLHDQSKLPRHFRHELLSVAIVEHNMTEVSEVEDAELLLHLVASHHGHARPWAPVCEDTSPQLVSLHRIGLSDVEIDEQTRSEVAYHRVDSPIVDRFWRLTRKYGWWGLACLETSLRLADQQVSQMESWIQSNDSHQRTPAEPTGVTR
ncbi:CRISPR-associated endonuclease/helicase Cas3 [Rhodopirellula rubra]|uniref:CRISPR-associated endonuclease/helicase Cas3 n=1 Tax=Aporhodopirellula rubra TaxID=980271 RepID=A0A7W5E110_9BACT|nr:type I-U CRISPR-associated helicase/endonuclease Cas3 [Aporhodopirellula rubra]MBB3208218.1 CRISPR-associated endonuclease/helicase Cas3 [Aporhodopirellula rubra]